MNSSTLWIVVTVVIVAVVVGILVWRARMRRLDGQRAEAAELRDTTAEHHLVRREREAAASSAEAEARRARAEADQRAAEAERLEVEADRRRVDRDAAREESAEQLRRADALDPEVRTDADGHRRAEEGGAVQEGPDLSASPAGGESGAAEAPAATGVRGFSRDGSAAFEQRPSDTVPAEGETDQRGDDELESSTGSNVDDAANADPREGPLTER